MNEATNKYSPEVRGCSVRMDLDNQGQHESRWSAIVSISSKIGCAPQTLNEWVKKVEVNTGQHGGITTGQAEKMKALEREVRESKQANKILRKASAYFAQAELPPIQTMIQFIEDHRTDHGVEPICRMLPIAPATFYDHLSKREDPLRLGVW